MNYTTHYCRCILAGFLLLALLGLGCEGEPRLRPENPPPTQNKPPEAETSTSRSETGKSDTPKEPSPPTAAKKVQLGKSLWFENLGTRRRVLVGATVCLREGSYGLECLLCRKNTKEHESILSTDADAELIHRALLAAKAEPGSPVRYEEKGDKVTVIPPKGDRIKVTLEWTDKGKVVRMPAQQWVRNSKTKKNLEEHWVFAGSKLWHDPDDAQKKPIYLANAEGGYICILNVPSALLDLPINNPNRGPEEREFQPHTERIPPLNTKVTIILERESQGEKPAK
jgi:hypothetical protein